MRRKQWIRKVLKWSGILFITGAVILLLFVWSIKAGWYGPLPSDDELKAIELNRATEIFSRDGQVVGRYFRNQRSPIPIEKVSPNVIDALIATEDRRFYSHGGIDYISAVRVVFKSIFHGDLSGGGSTLSQQLVKNLYARDRRNKFRLLVSKIKEMLIAERMEDLYSKEEILALYLNAVPFGEDVYGIELAAKRYFSKSAAELSVPEAATLVGMLKANHYYNPRLFPERSTGRRNVVLKLMEDYGAFPEDSLQYYQNQPMQLGYSRVGGKTGTASYFRERLRQELEEWSRTHRKENGTRYNLYLDGLRVYTTIDFELQESLEVAIEEHMNELQRTFLKHWSGQKPWDSQPEILDRAIRKSRRYKELVKAGLNHPEALNAMDKKFAMTIPTPDGEKRVEMSPIDSIKHYLLYLHAGGVAMDPQTGAILAWVGGTNRGYFQYDHVKESTKRQVGSTFKPFVYAAALEKGLDPCDYVSGRTTKYTNYEDWKPENSDKDENELKYSYEGALSASVNTVTVKVMEETGISTVIKLAQDAGINSDLPEVPALALGAADISLIEMASAYCAFANAGSRVRPHFLERIEDRNGNVIYEHRQDLDKERDRVMKPETAGMINAMLQKTVEDGTAAGFRNTYQISNKIAGKTGTTQSNADGWFIGYTPKVTLGVWVGADDPSIHFRTTTLGSGANMAMPIVAKTVKQMNADPRLRRLSTASFPTLPDDLLKQMDCDAYREDKNFLEKLLNVNLKKDEKVKEYNEDEKKGLFNRLRNKKD